MRLWLNRWLTICTRAFEIFAHFCTTKSFQVVRNNTCAKVQLASRGKSPWSVPLIGDRSSPILLFDQTTWTVTFTAAILYIFIRSTPLIFRPNELPPLVSWTRFVSNKCIDQSRFRTNSSYINFNFILQINHCRVPSVNLIDSKWSNFYVTGETKHWTT